MQLAQQGFTEGVVLLTDSQVAGKGRQGRQWVDVSGCNVITSLILRPHFAPHVLVMLASLAVVDAIAQLCQVTATIKWPNDVLIAERKVAGILIETSHDSTGRMIAIVGIGVNANAHPALSVQEAAAHEALLQRATSLEYACGHSVSREHFIALLLQEFETWYLALQDEARQQTAASYTGNLDLGAGSTSRQLRERWRSQLSTLGRAIEVHQGETLLSGVAEDVNDNGELLLRLHSGKQISITWGDIWHPLQQDADEEKR
jgi:BirA family biotin operon repressor/biotin-[acetyl-CoA-carboxylase] ligase